MPRIRPLDAPAVGVLLMTTLVALAGHPGALIAQDPPAADEGASALLAASPRHGEWVRYDAGDGDLVSAWVVYPERSDNAPVIVVIHDIGAMSDWIRGVADQLAAEGYIAIAPDLLSGKGPDGGGTESIEADRVRMAMRDLDPAEVDRRLEAAAAYGTSLPAALDVVGVVGFCWGGSTSFRFATSWEGLDAAVVYYGTSPRIGALARIEAPVLGLYAGDDQRVNATIEDARVEMVRLGKRYEIEAYDGAGHGFLRRQSGREGANLRAARSAWPRTVDFFRTHLGR